MINRKDNSHFILAINPGSTSTKFGLFENEMPLFTQTADHSRDDLAPYESIYDELSFRFRTIDNALGEAGYPLEDLDAVVGRGGLLRPISCGTYPVTETMARELKKISLKGGHASNLGGLLARGIADPLGIPAFIVDPVIVDEMIDEARFTGIPGIRRKSIWHALNQKAAGRRGAEELGKPYEELNLIVAHLGGGITVGAHKKGRAVDVNDGLNGDGPFSPQRTGAIPAADMVELCFSGETDRDSLLKVIRSGGGLSAYFGSQDAREVIARIDRGDDLARRIYGAMAYRIACEIGARTIPLKGKVDALILTGGLAHEERLIGLIKKHTHHIAPVLVYPGEDELLALTQGALRVLNGEEEARDYETEAAKGERAIHEN